MKPYSECDESPVVWRCHVCGELNAEDECPYCEHPHDCLCFYSYNFRTGIPSCPRHGDNVIHEDTRFDARDRRRNRAVGSDEWYIGDVV